MHIQYHTPKLYKTKTTKEETESYSRIIRTHTTDYLKDESLSVPVLAMIHPKAILDIAKLGKSCMTVAMTLTTFVQSRTQNNIVFLSQTKLARLCDISIRSVISSLDVLEENGFIKRSGKQEYKLSPKLVWFGTQIDWAIALREEEKI